MGNVFPIIQRVAFTVPAQLVVGGLLGWMVWAVFKRLGSLSPLLDHDAGMREWLVALNGVLDRQLGSKYFSWRCFWRFSAVSISVTLIAWLCLVQSEALRRGPQFPPRQLEWPFCLLILAVGFNIIFDYRLLAKTRYIWKSAIRRAPVGLLLLVGIDVALTIGIRIVPLYLLERADVNGNFVTVSSIAAATVPANYEKAKEVIRNAPLAPGVKQSMVGAVEAKRIGHNSRATWLLHKARWLEFYAIPTCLTILSALLTYLWLGLCVGSAALLRRARRFGIDVDGDPLGSFAFMAGAMVAIAYCSLVGLSLVL